MLVSKLAFMRISWIKPFIHRLIWRTMKHEYIIRSNQPNLPDKLISQIETIKIQIQKTEHQKYEALIHIISQ